MKKPTLPNLLLIGAAKSGTTSIYQYLKSHPEIFFPDLKEPKFITSQFIQFPFKGPGDEMVEKFFAKSLDTYLSLYENVTSEHVIGDASADTLYYYQKSIPVIKKTLGDPKVLIILRSPIDRAFSSFLHMKRDKRELLSFSRALKEENNRIKNNYEFIWHYTKVGLYYAQVKNYTDNFKNVHICLFDDLKNDIEGTLKKVFIFLKVDPDFLPPNLQQKYNENINIHSDVLENILNHPNRFKENVKLFLELFLTDNQIGKIADIFKNTNRIRKKIDWLNRKKLKKKFFCDVNKLQKLIGRDLTHWLE